MVLHGPAAIESNPLALAEIDTPEPGPGEILVRVTASAVPICTSVKAISRRSIRASSPAMRWSAWSSG
jgi:NADPH:quinone reductase-like Zn-dependent oxidoreductase